MGQTVISAPQVLTGGYYPYDPVKNPLGQKTWTQYYKGSYPTNLTTGTSGQTIASRIIYGNGIYAFVSNQGVLYYSTDAKSWNIQYVGNQVFYCIEYGNSIWILAGNAGVLYSGTPGGTWTARTSQFGGGAVIQDVRWLSGLSLFVAAGQPTSAGACAISTSSDGITWTNRLNDTNSQAYYNAINYDSSTNTVAVACGSSTNNLYYSTNGTSWSVVNTGTNAYQVQFIKGALNRWAGANNSYFSSTSANIGSTWSSQNPLVHIQMNDNNLSISQNIGGYPRAFWEMQYDSVNNYYYQICPPVLNTSSGISGFVPTLLTYDASTIQTTRYYSSTSYVQGYPIIKAEPLIMSSLTAAYGAPLTIQEYAYLNGVHIYILFGAGADNNLQIFTTA